jgi:DNA-binding HxlR family transcriptional regulator
MRGKRPIPELLDLLGRRWLLRLLWELREGPLTFRALRERCDGISPSVLSQRVAELREHGLVEVHEDGYLLSREGHSLAAALEPLDAWARRWSKRRS